MNVSNLAVAIIVKNEEKDLPGCLDSVKLLGSPVYVFDSDSSDKSRQICETYGVNVVNFVWNRSYPKKKQWALNYLKLNFEWVLLIDADERLSEKLVDEIIEKVKDNASPQISAFDVKLEYWFEGKKLRFGQRIVKRVLIRPKKVYFPVFDDLRVDRMWEVEGHYHPILISGQKKFLKSRLIHVDSDGLYSFFDRHNRYSDWEAHMGKTLRSDVIKRKSNSRFTKNLFLLLPFKGLIIFCFGYIVRLGFLDGRAGFDYAVSKCFYYWQIRAKEIRL